MIINNKIANGSMEYYVQQNKYYEVDVVADYFFNLVHTNSLILRVFYASLNNYGINVILYNHIP